MAEMRNRVDWEKAAATGRRPGGREVRLPPVANAGGSRQRAPQGRARSGKAWLGVAACAPAVGLGFLLGLWMDEGPLVGVAGCAATFVLSLLGCLGGGVVWLVSGSDSVFRHFRDMLPWGEPGFWRGLAGVVTVSMLAWLIMASSAKAAARSEGVTRALIWVMLVAAALLFAAGAVILTERGRGPLGLGL